MAFCSLTESKNRFLFPAVDRYRCIMQPDRPHFNSFAAVSISLVMTILSVLLTIPMFVTAEVRFFQKLEISCDVDLVKIKLKARIY
jgi:hypothetical protein